MSSIKGNIILNAIHTITGILFPVVTFPYAARVLLPEGIGAVNFLNSIIAYIVMATSLGIPMYAVKEIAKYNSDKYQRDKKTIEILLLSTSLCLIGYVCVWLLAEFVPQIHRQSTLFFILSLSILFTSIGADWFYQGIENFKYITIRGIVVRTLAASALFIFVRKPSDLLIYGVIVVGSTVGNNLLNFINLRKYINFREIKLPELDVLSHLKPALQIFLLNVIISLYMQLNSIMLGFISGEESVGYFSAGSRISQICLAMVASLGTVLLPRCSHLIKTGNTEGFKSVINNSMNLTLALSMPMAIGIMILAYPITMVFCGSDFAPSATVLLVNAPTIVIMSVTNIMGIQVLYPMDKINIVIISATSAAIFNIALNFLLMPHYGATGAAISTLVTETSVLFVQIILGHKYFPFPIKALINMKYIVSSLIMGVAVYLTANLFTQNWLMIAAGIGMGIFVYFLSLLTMKESLLMMLIAEVKTKLTVRKA